ncbi:MAG TPA: cytochrome c [Pyrinomonadaceae bacterium]|jgi:mono/diheme cytochrome c family protein
MKIVKLALIAAAISLFFIACNDTASNNRTTANGTVQTSPTASPAASATPAATPADELAAAKTTYSQVCSACHQDKGEGGMVKLEGKRIKVPSLTEGHGLEHTDAELAKQIANGGDGMPAFKGKLSDEQINDLVRFIRRDIQGGAQKATPSSPVR